MKVFVVLLALSAMALASLEPAGYRPPGSSSTSSQYLPPHLQYEQHQQHQQQQQQQPYHYQPQPSNPPSSPSSQYLTPTYNRPTAPVSPSSQYLPPRPHQQQQQQQQQAPIPSSNYLPAMDKPLSAISSLAPSSLPTNNYLPPSPLSSSPIRPSNEYLPPLSLRPQTTSVIPTNEYLPPNSKSTPVVPSNNYLPPLANRQPIVQAENKYLPPLANAMPPKSDYLPPSRQSPAQRLTPTTPVPRISVVSVAPFKLDGPAYTKPQPQQPKSIASSGLATSATASPLRSSGFTQSGYPSAAPVLGAKSYEGSSFQQPADNYLPPLEAAPAGYSSSADSGYRYGSAAGAAARVEEPTEPAKYDFEYRVSDEFGNDYAHKEMREGAQTQGVYSVLLPDGRKQIVHYEADEEGFRPRISYEETASVLGSKASIFDGAFSGYDKNANSLDAQGPY